MYPTTATPEHVFVGAVDGFTATEGGRVFRALLVLRQGSPMVGVTVNDGR
jgi:hypothetical protein